MYYATSSSFDFKNCVPTFIWIEHCRMFEKQLVVLDPKFNVDRDGDFFLITENQGYVDISKDFRLNFLALCGRNGAGKSTFLRMLSGRHSFESEYTVCWIDSVGEVACSESIKLKLRGRNVPLESRVHNYKLSTLCGNGNLGERGEDNHIGRGLLQVYSKDPTLFNLHDKPVFDGFHLDRTVRASDAHDLERELSEHLGIVEKAGFGPFQEIIESHPTFHVLASIAQDSTFKDLVKILKYPHLNTYEEIFAELRDEESDQIDKNINELIYTHGVRGDPFRKGPNNVLSPTDPDWFRYEIEDYDSAALRLLELSRKTDRWIRKKLFYIKSELWKTRHINLKIWSDRLMQLVSFSPFKDYGGKIHHLGDLSDGEYSQIQLLFNLAPMIMPEEACWFYYDDIDDYLHPEWKRNLVNRIATTYREFSSRVARSTRNKLYTDKTLLCVIATHSPFVLSDLPKDCVLQFVKGTNGKTTINRSAEDTFAGNIGELFHTEFFMDSTIGEFAKQEISKAIKKLEDSPSPEELERIRNLFSMVGDDVLKNLLMEKLHHAESRT